ncbi:MAG: tyrosine-type recombinase/integrase [Acidobacteriota bacterium]|jgi:integrase
MSKKLSCCSVLSPIITEYLALERALGKGYANEERVLHYLDSFLAEDGSDLTPESFADWCLAEEHHSSGVRCRWMRIVRNLCLYRRRKDLACFVPDPSQFPRLNQPVQPHIFTEVEIIRLLRATDTLAQTPRAPLCRETYHLAIVLLYTTGLRRGELVRLTVGDYDPVEHTLLVRESKFHKSRLLPLSPDGFQEIDSHLKIRRARLLPVSAETPLLWNRYKGGNGYTGVGFAQRVRSLFRVAEIRTASGRLPRVHDFRHSFCVNALLRWYRSGADVQAKLPFLATYVGHVSIVSTEYYLPFVNDLAAAAIDRFARHCGNLIAVPSALAGGAP